MDASLAKDQEDAADYLVKANLFTSRKGRCRPKSHDARF